MYILLESILHNFTLPLDELSIAIRDRVAFGVTGDRRVLKGDNIKRVSCGIYVKTRLY